MSIVGGAGGRQEELGLREERGAKVSGRKRFGRRFFFAGRFDGGGETKERWEEDGEEF